MLLDFIFQEDLYLAELRDTLSLNIGIMANYINSEEKGMSSRFSDEMFSQPKIAAGEFIVMLSTASQSPTAQKGPLGHQQTSL